MPNRLIRDGILSSERIQKLVELGGWEAEVFYRRLLSVVDDYGRFSANPSLLRAQMYPLELERVREANVSRCLRNCEAAGLVRLYEVGSKPYILVNDFNQQVRAKSSKYPEPPDAQHMHSTCAADAKHMKSFAHLGGGGGADVVGGGGASDDASTAAVVVVPLKGGSTWALTPQFVAELQQDYPDIDIVEEARRMVLWLKTNTDRLKTERGMPRAMRTWLNKAIEFNKFAKRHSPQADDDCVMTMEEFFKRYPKGEPE